MSNDDSWIVYHKIVGECRDAITGERITIYKVTNNANNQVEFRVEKDK